MLDAKRYRYSDSGGSTDLDQRPHNGKKGILDTIEKGGAIDEGERRKIGGAFQVIQQAWLGQQMIPKEVAQLLHQQIEQQVEEAITKCLR